MPNNGETEDVRTSAINRRNVLLGGTTLAAASAIVANNPIQGAQAQAQAQPAATDGKPNILVIWGDDIGIANISTYSNGLMGYETPNIDRIGREGIMFLHYYGEQSCTAGRAAFLTGQHGIRAGLTKVGFPGAPMGMSQLDPSVGGLLKNLGYATGQFGKNHIGDRNESLPTVNGFDEFVGNLYHLNAEEEPELPDYPKDPAYLAKYGPRGVLKCKATDRDDPTVDPRFGKIGKQTIEDTGPLTKKRMETIDDETSTAAIDYMKRQHTAGKPFFVWFNSTRMHLRTHVRAEHRGRYKHGDSEYIDGMMEHDDTVGTLLKALDDMGIANNTIVVYSSDNGPHMNTWPDAAMTWFRSERDTNWEGAFRVPCLVRWPGKIKPGTVTNEIMSHNDWIPTLCAAAGEPDIVNKLKAGYTANGINYKVHLDGYNQLAFLRDVSGSAANNNGTKSAAISSSTPTTTACSWACGKAITNTAFPNSACREQCKYGPNPSPRFGSKRSTTSCRTRSNERTSRPTPTGIGRSTTSVQSMARWTRCLNSWRRSRNSRRAHSHRASTPPISWKARLTVSRRTSG